MRAKRGVLAAGTALAVAACGVPIQSGAHFAGGWRPSERATFAWNDEADHTQGDVRLEDNALFHARLHEAVEWELNLRGIRQSDVNPDFLIHHHFSLADHELVREMVDEQGIRSSEIEVYEGGSIVLHIVDARTDEDRWVAWAQANVEPALTGPGAMTRWVYDLVGEMFGSWPVPARFERTVQD
jgi:hypothetical protein